MMLREPWRTRLLFLSVAGNLFAVALIGRTLTMRQPHGPPGSAAIVDHMAHEMPPDDAARFRAIMAEGTAAERPSPARDGGGAARPVARHRPHAL